VVVLDEIEKAHDDIIGQVRDSGQRLVVSGQR
jgi:ATP-dependent Clp protease ATP-binding subunit ClpA